MASYVPLLRCRCGAPLPNVSSGRCQACGTGIETDDLGIVRLARNDVAWTAAPPSFVEAIRAASTPEEGHAATRTIDPATAGRLVAGRYGGLAVLAALGEDADVQDGLAGRDVLVRGASWTDLPNSLGFLGARVTLVDECYARLRYTVLCHPGPWRAVHVDASPTLPFMDGQFSTVFLDVGAERRTRGRRASQSALAEAKRVLGPAGVVVSGVEHPAAAARQQAPGGVPGILGRALRALGPGDLLAPWRAGFSSAGLRPFRTLIAVPDSEGQQQLLPPDRARRALRTMQPRSRSERLRRVAAPVGLLRWVAPRWIVLARRPGAAVVTPLADALVGGPAAIIPRATARVALDGRLRFAKVPLSGVQERGVIAEVARTRAAAGGPWRDAVLSDVAVVPVGPVRAAVFPHVETVPVGTDELERRLDGLLDALPAEEYGDIASTDLYRRVVEPPLPENVVATGCEGLRRRLLDADAAVHVGPTHGDLNAGNLLALPGGGLKVIDWVRFEPRNPLFLDAVFAALALHWKREGVGLHEALADFVADRIPGPLAARATRLLGAMTRRRAAAWVLLHEVTALQGKLSDGDGSNRRRIRLAVEAVDGMWP